MRIAMIGQRGVPATFGGVEHHVEELGSRLAALGHEVTVFNRTNYVEERVPEHKGMRLRYLPTVSTKHLDALMHSGISTLAAMAARFDIVHYHALGPGIPSFLPRVLSSAKVVQTVHGLDSQRAKWGRPAKAALTAAEFLSARVPDATIVVAKNLRDYYLSNHNRRVWHIPNGVNPPQPRPPHEIAHRYGLERDQYVLFVGRLVPEKAPDLLLKAFRTIPGKMRLVIAGGSSYTNAYVDSIRDLAKADERVLLLGYVYGSELEELYSNAASFVLPSSLEGLPLTLLEAASYGTPVIVSDIAPHREVVGNGCPGKRLFRTGDQTDLAAALRAATASPDQERAAAVGFAAEVIARYNWDRVAYATENVYRYVREGKRAHVQSQV